MQDRSHLPSSTEYNRVIIKVLSCSGPGEVALYGTTAAVPDTCDGCDGHEMRDIRAGFFQPQSDTLPRLSGRVS